MIEEQIEAYETLLCEIDKDDRLSRKRIEHMKEMMEAKLEGLATLKDDLLHLGELGIDQILVDEAQQFRKLSFATNQGDLKGVAPEGSQRAWDLFVKARYLERVQSRPRAGAGLWKPHHEHAGRTLLRAAVYGARCPAQPRPA
jgi:N12 class adenine-specific DNA methylase